MRRGGGERGQAAGEYVALVALVAVALTLAAGLTSGGVGAGVLAGLQRGLCRVAGGACPRPLAPRPDLAPCPLGRERRSEELRATIAALRLGSTGTLDTERTSDGRVTVTLAKGSAAGGELGVGVRLGGAGASGRAGAGIAWTSGSAWSFPDEAAARRFAATYGGKVTIGGWLVDEVRSRCSLLCDAIGWRPHPRLPEPDETFEEGGALATLAGALGLRGGTLGLGGAAVLGRRVARDGARTWYLRVGAAAVAGLHLDALELGADAGGEAVIAYALDARGRPATLGIQVAGEASGHLGAAGARAGGGLVTELEATLDLHGAANRAAAAALLGALRDPRELPALPGRVARLAALIAREGRIDRRLYAVRDAATGVDGLLALGLELGGGFERATRGLRLVRAETRLPGLPFLPRDDCRPA